MNFEWDRTKAERNLAKHGVTFDEAASVFLDTQSRTIFDENHSESEDRYLTLGFSSRGRLLIVWFTMRGEAVRIIGARKPERHEQRGYPDE